MRNLGVLLAVVLGLVACNEDGGGDTQVITPPDGTVGGIDGRVVDPPVEDPDAAPLEPDAALPEPDAAPPEPDAAPEPELPVCEGEAFAPVNERATLEAVGLHYQGLDGEANPMNAMLIDIRDTEGLIGPGTYDLAGTNLADCEVCVAGLKGCNPATGQCQKVFYPKSGVVEITALGGVGERFTATLHGVDLEEVTVTRGTNESVPVPGGATWCNPTQVIDVEILPRPVQVGETVADFSLQNCETGEFVSVHELAAEAKGLWLIASAGWCAACRQFLPEAIRVFDQIDNDLGEGVMKAMIVVGEDSNYGQPTVEYCRQYAARYNTDISRFYIDHNGTGSFATTFQYIWPYPGADGSFSLPWNALIKGGTYEYFYADRSGMSDLNTALNAILR